MKKPERDITASTPPRLPSIQFYLFYQPFQETVAALLGFPFYFAVPERRTVILFGKETLPRYLGDFRDDILLTYETSTRSLSPELIEASESGLVTVSV